LDIFEIALTPPFMAKAGFISVLLPQAEA